MAANVESIDGNGNGERGERSERTKTEAITAISGEEAILARLHLMMLYGEIEAKLFSAARKDCAARNERRIQLFALHMKKQHFLPFLVHRSRNSSESGLRDCGAMYTHRHECYCATQPMQVVFRCFASSNLLSFADPSCLPQMAQFFSGRGCCAIAGKKFAGGICHQTSI